MWVKIDDQFPDHPKVVQAGYPAAWLHITALCYCGRYLTDGIVPKDMVTRLTTLPKARQLAQRLVDVGLWHDRPDLDAYEIHDYLDYQPARTSVEAERDAARERMTKARSRKRSPEQAANTADGSGEVRANNQRTSPEVRVTPSPSPSLPPLPPHAGQAEQPADQAGDGTPADGRTLDLNHLFELIATQTADRTPDIRDRRRYIAAVTNDLAERHTHDATRLHHDHPTWDIHDIAQHLDPAYQHPTGKSVETRHLEAQTEAYLDQVAAEEAQKATLEQAAASLQLARAAAAAARHGDGAR